MTERNWVSGQVCFRGGIYARACDDVLLSVVRPLMTEAVAAGLAAERFFIRYSESVPHVRVRLLPCRGVSPLTVRGFVEAQLARHGVVVANDRSVVADRGLWWRRTRYIPETDRYGGTRGVEIAEHLFTQSSLAVLSWLAEMGTDRAVSRVGLGLGAMLAAFALFFPEPQAAAIRARHYSDACLAICSKGVSTVVKKRRQAIDRSFERQEDRFHRIVEAYWNGASIDRFDDYVHGLREVRALLVCAAADGLISRKGQVLSEHEAFGLLVPSYVHMTSNRLGLSIGDEAFLAYAIWRATAATVLGRADD